MDIKSRVTNRGFRLVEFTDLYGQGSSLQESSLAGPRAIWFGINDAEPKILASQAAALGVETSETEGWIPYPVPTEVNHTTRMHLSQDQVRELLPLLQHFAETGELP